MCIVLLIIFFVLLSTVELIYRFDHLVLPLVKVRLSYSSRPFLSNFVSFSDQYLSDPRSVELEQQIQSAVDKQKRPDSSISEGEDSEAFPTSDDHQLASCSASASESADVTDRFNRFDILNRDNLKATRRRTTRKSSNSNHQDENDDDDDDQREENNN